MLKKITSALVILLFALIFARLGVWQLDRAELVQEISQPQREKPALDLVDLAKPNSRLPEESRDRLVRLKGTYLDILLAPNQENAEGLTQTWQVGVLKVSTGGKILIVRGVADEDLAVPSGNEVEILGRLTQSQINIRFGEVSDNKLSRIDSSLLLSRFGSDFFDGFIMVKIEDPPSNLPLIPTPLPRAQVAGFYWQHISYVIIWWLMALLTLTLPWIRSRRDSI